MVTPIRGNAGDGRSKEARREVLEKRGNYTRAQSEFYLEILAWGLAAKMLAFFRGTGERALMALDKIFRKLISKCQTILQQEGSE